MFKYLIIAALALQLACGTEKVEDDTCDEMKDYDEYRSHDFYSWQSRAIKVTLDPASAPDLKKSSYEAAKIWNDQLGFDLLQVSEATPVVNADDPESMYLENNITDVQEKWLERFPQSPNAAGTTFSNPVRVIEKGVERKETSWFDIYINRELVKFSDLALEVPNKEDAIYDLTSLLLHEFGHGLGLVHNSKDESSVMYPSIPRNKAKRSPCIIETTVLRELYPPLP